MSAFEPMSEEALKDFNAAEEARDLAIAERDEAYRQRDELGREGDTAHALLNDSIGSRVVPRKGETALVSQARTAAEVVADLRLQLRAIESIRSALETPEGKAVTVHAVDVMAELRLLRAAAEAEPAQTFEPKMTVTVSECDGKVFAEVDVGLISDPAFLALSGHQLARLALVVTRG